LEKLHGIELAHAQRSGVLGHRRTGNAVEAIEVDAGPPEIVGEADPRRRYFGHRGEFQLGEIGQAEVGRGLAPITKRGIAGTTSAKQTEEVGISRCRARSSPATGRPHHIGLAGAQRGRRQGIGRRPQVDLDAGVAKRAGGVSA
jgi:hypothetical protein